MTSSRRMNMQAPNWDLIIAISTRPVYPSPHVEHRGATICDKRNRAATFRRTKAGAVLGWQSPTGARH
jgi:hypothetical protein